MSQTRTATDHFINMLSVPSTVTSLSTGTVRKYVRASWCLFGSVYFAPSCNLPANSSQIITTLSLSELLSCSNVKTPR